MTAHRRVAPCAQSLTYVRVRSLVCSVAPCAASVLASRRAIS